MTDTNVTNTHNGHEFVDLGLPLGTLWATCNVGATSPEQSGLYFAWGETTGYTAEQVTSGERAFDMASYKASSISADLTLEQDAAHVNLGGNWRMPTNDEWQELIDNCDGVRTNDYNGTGVAGHIFVSKINGNSVFFPTAGTCFLSSAHDVGSYGRYWSATWKSRFWALCLYLGLQKCVLKLNGKLSREPRRPRSRTDGARGVRVSAGFCLPTPNPKWGGFPFKVFQGAHLHPLFLLISE